MKRQHIRVYWQADPRLRLAVNQLAAERRDAPLDRVEPARVRLHAWDQLLEAKRKGKS